jgi:hypothetical protein
MIQDPDYLTWLRSQYRCQDVLNLLHLSAAGIGWYLLGDLALTFCSHRATINQSMLRLRRHGLVEYTSYGAGGTFVWWQKQHPHDRPDRGRDFPRWKVRDLSKRGYIDVLVGEQALLARRAKVHPGTVKNFLAQCWSFRESVVGPVVMLGGKACYSPPMPRESPLLPASTAVAPRMRGIGVGGWRGCGAYVTNSGAIPRREFNFFVVFFRHCIWS